MLWSRLFKTAILVCVIVFLQICGSTAMAQIPIGTIEDLSKIGREADYPLNGSYVLTSDIEAFDTVNWNNGTGFEPIGTKSTPFTGQFNGGGYVIRNLTINRQTGYVGLFAYVDQSGEISDVGMEGGMVSGSSCYAFVGGLVGYNGGTITNSYTTCSVTVLSVSGDQCDIHAGGLVGYNKGGVIKSTYATGSVAAVSGDDEGGNGRQAFVGGLIGDNEEGSIDDSYSTGAVTANVSGSYVGGLIGSNGDSIKNCYATGSVAVSTSGSLCDSCVGGLVGLGGNGSITECYAAGYVSASSDPDSTSSNSHIRIGGLVGYSMANCDIVQCYATGGVEAAGIFTLHEAGGLAGCNAGFIEKSCARGGVKISTPGMYASSSIGGLVGENSTGNIVNCYATGAVSGTDTAGGLVGSNYYGDVSYCYAVGSVDAFDEGGLVGVNRGSVTASFWDIDSTGQSRSAGGTGLHFEEMRWQSTYTGWDFGTVWSIKNGATYPFLYWEWQGCTTFVPNVIGGSQAWAIDSITSGGFRVGQIIRECSDEVTMGTVIDQSPSVTAEVGTPIDIWVSSGPCTIDDDEDSGNDGLFSCDKSDLIRPVSAGGDLVLAGSGLVLLSMIFGFRRG